MKKIMLLISFCFVILSSFGQGITNLWLMGYDCCDTIDNPMNFEFSSGSLVITPVPRKMNINATVGQICDRNGNLLFYSNGVYVSTSLDDTMQNGSGLNPSFFTTAHTRLGLTLPQANLVLPSPGDSLKYYLFHQTIDDPDTYASLHLFYSIIDLAYNNGLGAVTQKNILLVNDSLIPGHMTACKHANGRDWWVICPQFHSGNVYKFLLTPSGLQGPFIQDLITWRDIGPGQALFNQQGTKFAHYNPYEDLDIWDFDRCTGDFTNQVHIGINDTAYAAGAAFSPSGRYLYLSSMNYIYQFDLAASNIDSSRVTVGVYDGFRTYGFYANFYLMSLAPDGKIYTNCGNSTTVLHVINYPDSAGLACGFCQHCLDLTFFNAFTIPNFPNYFLGAEGGTVCDSLPTSITSVTKPLEEFSVFPNPAQTEVYLTLSKQKVRSAEVYNSYGQRIECTSELIKDEYIRFDVSALQSGVYYIEIVSDKRKQVKMFVKE